MDPKNREEEMISSALHLGPTKLDQLQLETVLTCREQTFNKGQLSTDSFLRVNIILY